MLILVIINQLLSKMKIKITIITINMIVKYHLVTKVTNIMKINLQVINLIKYIYQTIDD